MTSNNKNTTNSGSGDDDWFGELVMSLFTAAGYVLWWAVLFPAITSCARSFWPALTSFFLA